MGQLPSFFARKGPVQTQHIHRKKRIQSSHPGAQITFSPMGWLLVSGLKLGPIINKLPGPIDEYD